MQPGSSGVGKATTQPALGDFAKAISIANIVSNQRFKIFDVKILDWTKDFSISAERKSH